MLYDPKWKQIDTSQPVIKRTDLTERELSLLLQVRAMLMDGTISDAHFDMSLTLQFGAYAHTNYLNNMQASEHISCGTIGCIGGWMTVLSVVSENCFSWKNSNTHHRHMVDPKFNNLFFPSDVIMKIATPSFAVIAIDNFLKGEQMPWDFITE